MTGTRHLLRPVLRLLTAVRPERSLFVRSTLSMTVFQVATAGVAGLSTAIATGVVAGADGSVIAALLIGLFAAVVTVAMFTWIESWLSHVLAYRVIDALRMRVFDAVRSLVPAGIGRRRTGEVTATAMNDVEVLEWFYAHTLGAGLNAVVSPLIVSVVLIGVVGPIGVIVPVGVALLLLVPSVLAGLQVRQGAAIRDAVGDLQAIAFEGAASRRELATLDLETHHCVRVLDRTDRVQAAKRRFALRTAAEAACADLIVAATSLGFLAALIASTNAGALDAALIPAALVLVTAAIAPATGAFAMVQRLGEMSAAAQRVLDLIDAANDGPGDEARSVTLPKGPGAVRFDRVGFAYEPGAERVLDDLTLHVHAGEHIALVGASGSGKTTIARLLSGLWRAQDGTVSIDGVDVSTATETSLRDALAMVSQHPFVFRGTVRDNLRLAAPDADDDALWRAVRNAGLAETSAALADGLDTRVGDRGTTLSGGQRQRLSIAQALLRDPAVLILDEASAQLDAIRESDLAHTVRRLRHRRTTIVIAHRLSTIRRAHRIVLIDDGRVVADGTHADLLEHCQRYRTLIAHDARR